MAQALYAAIGTPAKFSPLTIDGTAKVLVSDLVGGSAALSVRPTTTARGWSCFFDALKNEHKFDAQGITGPIDIGGHQPPTCMMIAQVKSGKWVRVYPSKPGSSTAASRTSRQSSSI